MVKKALDKTLEKKYLQPKWLQDSNKGINPKKVFSGLSTKGFAAMLKRRGVK